MNAKNLDQLLCSSTEANAYFTALPDQVREQICSRPFGIDSLDSLKNYAECLMSALTS